MPQIPLYQQQGAPAAAHPFSISNTGAVPFSGQLDQAGELIMRRGAQLADEFDTVAATQAYNEWRDEERVVLTDKDKGLLAREGTNAYGVQKEYTDWHDKTVSERREKNLGNDRQRAYFDRLTLSHKETTLNGLASHEIQQHRAAQKDAETGFITNGVMDVRSKVGDRSIVASTIKGPDGSTVEIMERPVDTTIRETLEQVDRINGGMTNAAKKAQIEQVMRKAEIEELIERKDFKTAKPLLDEHRVKLGESYFALKNAVEREEKEDRVTRMYVAGVEKFPTSPEGRIRLMDDQKFLNANFPGWKLEEVERVKNVGKSEIQWRKYQKGVAEEEARDTAFKTVLANMQPGPGMNIKGAEEAFYRAVPTLRPQDIGALQNVINTVANNYDDAAIIDPLRAGIADLTVKKPSEIQVRIGYGVSRETGRVLMQELKDRWDNPGRAQFIKQAMDTYEADFGKSPEMMMIQPQVHSWLLDRAIKNNLQGPEILDELRKFVGTPDQLYDKGWFGAGNIGLGFLGAGDKASKAPVGKVLDAEYQRKSGESGKVKDDAAVAAGGPEINTPQTMTEQAQKLGADNIPQAVKSKIVEILTASGKSTSEANIVRFYKQNQDKLGKYGNR